MKGTFMGKNSFTNGKVQINGQTKSSTYKKGNTVYTNYSMSPNEKKAYDYAQKSFAENLPNLNVFSEDTQRKFDNQMKAYRDKGLKTIDSIYTPMIDNMKTDIASRFGNFDNSSFLNDLNDIESNRSDAISSFAQDMILKENDLVNDELSRRYNYMSFLNGINNQALSNMSGFTSMSSNNSSLGNSSSSSSSGDIGSYIQMGMQLLRTFYS